MIRWVVGSSLKFRRVVVAVALGIIVVGLFQLGDTEVDALPEFNPTIVEVQTEALGLSAREVEQLITVPLEQDLLNGIAFLEEIESAPERGAYLSAAARLPERCVLTGRLEHEELADLLPACEAQVVSSTFPEAFGMVAAEAAACGILPVSAAHSGLAEVTRALSPSVPEAARPWLSFGVGPGAVRDLAASLVAWLEAPQDVREGTREGLVEVVRERYSWEGVARTVVGAARGELSQLDPVT
jgi:glycosyltransferase involved in cell wall biosynthesis